MPDASYPMPTRPVPLVERGAEALYQLLKSNRDGTLRNLHLLTRSELDALAIAADDLAALAREIRRAYWPISSASDRDASRG